MLSQLFVTPWTVAHQVPLSKGFSEQEYCSGLPCLPLGDLPDPGIKLLSPASPALAGGFFTTEPPGNKICTNSDNNISIRISNLSPQN